MSGNASDATSKTSSAVNIGVEDDAVYHVRLIHSWPPLSKSPPLDKTLISSFYGLQLELRGKTKDQDDPQSPITLFNDGQSVSKTGEVRKAATAALYFGSNSPPSPAVLAPLEAITGPFEIVVLNKMSISTPAQDPEAMVKEDVLATLQQMAPVQVENTLLEINGERIVLDSSSTGADVYRRLWCVTSRASLAMPYELTLRRHNLAQASSKIVPFARRKEVQDAQIAQLGKLAAQEASLPIDIRRKKLFLVQQLDFEREHYLVAHVSGPLQQLHTNIMGDGRWQAYEYGKTLWYFHAPTERLYAQHPLRSHPEARELIERVQQQVHQAVRRLQRKTRSRQRRKRLMAVIQAEMQRREDEKRKEQQRLEHAVRQIQRRIRAYQRRKRFLALIEAAKRRQEGLQREKQRAEERRQEELRAEENRQLEQMKQEQQRLQKELTELKAEIQQLWLLKETKLPVHTGMQTSARRDESAIETMRKEEHQRLQQRLEKLELELQNRKEIKPGKESETQTSSRSSENEVEQQRARHRIEELELQLGHRNIKDVVESVTQTSGRRGGALRDEAVDTGDDLEWQRYLTLLRVAVKKKKKASPKSRHTQTDNVDGEETLLASSMLRAPQHAVSFSPSSRKFTGEWKGFPSWRGNSNSNSNSNSGYSSNSSSTSSLLTLKSSLSQFDELDTISPPTRTFESYFAPDLNMTREQPPPPVVEQPWRQDSTYLPLKSSRKMLEITPVHQPLHEYEDPIRPMRNSSSFMITPASSPTSATKLPYITRRRKNHA
ncbi:hypothetical protein ON010_g9064 [Phytophthora cinnamomi]|nr:hypothetical protein ON010_g9064 [Phytophthora cinnamomi]